MIDFSKTINIIFVAVSCALFAFMLASAIVVFVKGKRKCSAFDVILRLVSSLCLAASAVLLACAVLAMLDGNARIDLSEETPVLVLGGSETALPASELFVALSTYMGLAIVATLTVLSIVALVADCLIANKKEDKNGKSVTDKNKIAKAQTPEQARRAAELEKIRRLGDAAVKKTNSAASHSGVKTTDSASAHDDAKASAKYSKQVQAEADTIDSGIENTDLDSTDDESFDWRVEPTQEHPTQDHSAQTGFIGITENSDPDFDTFDTFDDVDGAPHEEREENFSADSSDELFGEGESEDTYGENTADESFDLDADEETEETDETDDIDSYADESEAKEDESDENDSAYEDAQDYGGGDEIADSAVGAEKSVSSQAYDEYGDIEPNRDIYIPKVRTIVRTARPTAAPKKPEPKAKRKTAAPASKNTNKSADKKAQTDTRKKRAAAKAVAPQSKETAAPKAPSKKLPVPRRYIILDRKSAVNAFSEYLKERDAAEKDKLKSSISTIIIK